MTDVLERILSRIEVTETGCWEWQGYRAPPQGYGMVYGGPYDEPTSPQYVHRVVYQRMVGQIPEGMFVLHRCDNPPCCCPDDLFLGTHQDNMADMTAKGRHWNRRLTELDKRNIRYLYSKGVPQTKIATVFQMSQPHVSTIIRAGN